MLEEQNSILTDALCKIGLSVDDAGNRNSNRNSSVNTNSGIPRGSRQKYCKTAMFNPLKRQSVESKADLIAADSGRPLEPMIGVPSKSISTHGRSGRMFPRN
jgi:hypothetical protein